MAGSETEARLDPGHFDLGCGHLMGGLTPLWHNAQRKLLSLFIMLKTVVLLCKYIQKMKLNILTSKQTISTWKYKKE